MKIKRTTLRNKLTVFIIFSPLIAFFISIILNACGQENKNLYLGIGTVILWIIGLLLITFAELLEEWKQYQIYNYNIIDKSLHSTQCYSITSNKLRIFSKKGWTTSLFYINDVIFVNCKNPKHSWWGICKKFEKNEPIWDLYHEFELDYEKNITHWAKIEILNDTKIKGAEHSQFNPEIN